MPCYLFTYHAYGSWMPNRAAGYVRRKEGVLAANGKMAQCYRENLKGDVVKFNDQVQQILSAAAREASIFLEADCHAVATDPSHLHLLISWQGDKTWQQTSKSIKHRLSHELNTTILRRKWFSKGSSRKRIKDREHFDYLKRTYLPRHRGLTWCAGES